MITILDEDHPCTSGFRWSECVLAGGLTLMLVILPVVIIASQEAPRRPRHARRCQRSVRRSGRWSAR